MLRRLYLMLIVVVSLAVGVTGFIAYSLINRYNDSTARRYLEAMSNTAAISIGEGDAIDTVVHHTISIFSYDQTPFRMTIVERDGTVLYDNEADPAEMDNHLFRQEIAQAFKTRQPSQSVRMSDTIGEEMLYMAVYEPVNDLVVRTAMPYNLHRASVHSLLNSTVAIILLLVLILLSFGLLYTHFLLQPLYRMRKTAEAIQRGDLSVRMTDLPGKSSEMTVLARSLNEMTEKLQMSIEELADRNASLDAILDALADPVIAVADRCTVNFFNANAQAVFGRQIKYRNAACPLVLLTHSTATETLAEKAIETGEIITEEMVLDTVAGEREFQVIASPVKRVGTHGAILTFHDISHVRQAQKMRSDFVANVTHELKTPLTSIRGFIETLRNGAIENKEVSARFLDIIDIEAERLHRLINDILMLSEIEMNQSDWESETFDLNALIDDVVVLLEDQAAERQVSFVLDNDPAELRVKANRYKLKQLLINLVDNAIKYNREGGQIFIDAARRPDGLVELRVRDTGPGIDREHQDRIFERFYRIDRSRSRELGGTGLGLSIVKHIAMLYRGQATVESEPGEGSTFRITLDV